MSKKNQNVFKQIADSLQRIGDNLEEAVTVLYVVGTELATLHDELKAFIEKPLNTTVKVEEVAQVSEKVSALMESKKSKPEAKEVFKVSFGKTVGGE
jgi:ribosome maturation factor RimP